MGRSLRLERFGCTADAAAAADEDEEENVENSVFVVGVISVVVELEDVDEMEAFLRLMLAAGEKLPVSTSLAFDILRASPATMFDGDVS